MLMALLADRKLLWVSLPEQELLRRELRWTRLWFRRSLGLAFSLIFLLLGVVIGYCRTAGSGSPRADRLESFFIVASGALAIGLWVYLIESRTLLPLTRPRARELLMTSIDASALWPGLLVAPILIPTLHFSILYAGVLGAEVIATLPGARDPLPMFAGALSALFLTMLRLAFLLAFLSAVSAFSVRRVLPQGGFYRTLAWGFVGFLYALSLAAVLLRGAIFSDGLIWAGLDSSWITLTLRALQWALWGTLLLAAYAGIWRRNLRDLRSPRMLDELRLLCQDRE